MGDPAADRFLDCVLQRSKKDIFLSWPIMLLIIPGSLGFLFYLLYRMYSDYGIWLELSEAGEYLVALFMCMDVSFIAYTMMKSLTLHLSRDAEWIDSLSDYADHEGKDVSRLRPISDEMTEQVLNRARLVSYLAFLAMFLMMILSFFVFDMTDYVSDGNPFEIPEKVVLVIALFDLSATVVFALIKIYRVDDIQSRFTEEFVRVMGDERIAEPMDSGIGAHRLSYQAAFIITAVVLYLIQYYLVIYLDGEGITLPQQSPVIMIVGLYFTFLFFFVIRTMNRHIRAQEGYEIGLINAIAEREGASGIDRVPYENGKPDDVWDSSFTILDIFYRAVLWIRRQFSRP